MGDRTFRMLCGYIGMTSLAMLNAFLEVLDPFVDMRILPCRSCMLECLLTMLHGSIGMPLFTMGHSFLGMFQGFPQMFVGCKGKSAEQRKTDKRGSCRYNQCSTVNSPLHRVLLKG